MISKYPLPHALHSTLHNAPYNLIQSPFKASYTIPDTITPNPHAILYSDIQRAYIRPSVISMCDVNKLIKYPMPLVLSSDKDYTVGFRIISYNTIYRELYTTSSGTTYRAYTGAYPLHIVVLYMGIYGPSYTTYSGHPHRTYLGFSIAFVNDHLKGIDRVNGGPTPQVFYKHIIKSNTRTYFLPIRIFYTFHKEFISIH